MTLEINVKLSRLHRRRGYCVVILTAKFALASRLWEQARVQCVQVEWCQLVIDCFFSVILPSKRDYAKSATWRTNIQIIVSHARPAFVHSVSNSFFLWKL